MVTKTEKAFRTYSETFVFAYCKCSLAERYDGKQVEQFIPLKSPLANVQAAAPVTKAIFQLLHILEKQSRQLGGFNLHSKFFNATLYDNGMFQTENIHR